ADKGEYLHETASQNKSRETRDVITEYEQVNVVRAFICDDRFEVHHVPHYRELACNTHPGVDLPCFPGYFECNMNVVTLRKRNLRGCCLAFIHENTKSPVEELRLGDLSEHFSELLLH